MTYRFSKTVPVGIKAKPVWLLSFAGLSACVLFSVFVFCDDFFYELGRISTVNKSGIRVFSEYYKMEPFKDVSTGFEIFKPYFVLLCLAAIFFYMQHYMGAKSVYTMRRLKNPCELYIRCLFVPCVFIISGIALIYLLNFLYIKTYIRVIPEESFFPWWNEGMWRDLL